MTLDPLPSRATVAAVALLLAAFFAALHFARPAPYSLAAGLPLMALGIVIRLATNASLRKNQETCREGLYAFCRHPMYLGTLLLAAGIAVVLNHAVGLGILAAALAISLYRMRREEHFLEQHLADYAAYRRETPAFPTPSSVARGLRSGRSRMRLSLRQCFLNGEILRLNLYLLLLVASALYLRIAGGLLVLAGALCLLLAALSARLHPEESRRSALDYVLPAALAAALVPLAAAS
jgi:protein-S-isoprenylcysteine O-methyltransferase Ste14